MSARHRYLALAALATALLIGAVAERAARPTLGQGAASPTPTRTDTEKLRDLRAQYGRLKARYATAQAESANLATRVAALDATIAALDTTPQPPTASATPQSSPTATPTPTETPPPTPTSTPALTSDERAFAVHVSDQAAAAARAMEEGRSFLIRHNGELAARFDLFQELAGLFAPIPRAYADALLVATVPPRFADVHSAYLAWLRDLNAAAGAYTVCAATANPRSCDAGNAHYDAATQAWTTLEPMLRALERALDR